MRELFKRSEMDILRRMHEEETGLRIESKTNELKEDFSDTDHDEFTDPVYYLLRWYYNEHGSQYVMFLEDMASSMRGFAQRANLYRWSYEAKAVAEDALYLEKCLGYPIEQLPKLMGYMIKDDMRKFWTQFDIELSNRIGIHVRSVDVSFVDMILKWRMIIGK